MIKVDVGVLKEQSNDINNYLEYYEVFGAPLVDEYTKDLDEKIKGIQNYMESVRKFNLEYDILSLQNMALDLSTTIYWVSDRFEKVDLLSDMSNIKYKDAYNEAYLKKQGDQASAASGGKYTTEQLKNFAEQEALNEKLINFIYSHAAKIVDTKLDAARELLKIVSKSISAQIQSMQSFGVQSKYGG